MTHCETCNGTGKILFNIFSGYQVCPDCKGRGHISSFKKTEYIVYIRESKLKCFDIYTSKRFGDCI